ncbi:VanZ family protein [Nodosilinea sp. LEGE 07088]|uniref:VanZ family protein n=1 Tax=Nodosilinea sp. LEGE 07088 TaxID=2777968 RepID=UPI0018811D61|nr:VanZ family protein [Nodosilinea sp. LEGE 07088]MBE9138110.1 VanZ family protein [Nodosilinea sp. LEGE 07088]
MNDYRNSSHKLNKLRKFLLKYWAFIGLTSSSMLIVLVCLSPFDIIYPDISSLSISDILHEFLNSAVSVDDLSANILLFLPLGFSLSGILGDRYEKIRKFIIIFFTCTTLSLAMEMSQFFIGMRSPSILDLIMNSFGGLLGATLLSFSGTFSSKVLVLGVYIQEHYITPKKLTFIAIAYIGLLVFLTVSIQRTNNFSNWDQSFPLVVGNESTGDRPWHGRISQLYIAGRSLSKSEIHQALDSCCSLEKMNTWTSFYELTNGARFPDRNGYSPDLVWHDHNPQMAPNRMLPINQKAWLLTQEPATRLISAIRQSSQFSLMLTVSTNDHQQFGPARIVSFSKDLFQRNLTIGQEQGRLIVRLRTPWSGIEGRNPEFAFPGVFKDDQPHRLLLTFDHTRLKLYIDSVEKFYTIRLSTDVLFFRFLPAVGVRNFQITPINQWFLRVAFYFLSFFLPAMMTILIIRNNHQKSYI